MLPHFLVQTQKFAATEQYRVSLWLIRNMFRSLARVRCGLPKVNGVRTFSKLDDMKDSRTKGPVTFYSLGLAMLVGMGIVGFYYLEKEKKTKTLARQVTTVGKPALGGPWVLVDQDGMAKTDASYRGRFTILYFGFTFCPDICPSELVKVGNVMKALEKNGIKNVTPLFISVDPKRDTVGQMKNYSQDFHPSIQYLTGTREQVAAAAKAYRVYFSKVDENENDDQDYLVDHSIVLYLVSPDGQFLDFFTQKMEVRDVVEKVEHYVKEYQAVVDAADRNK